MESARSSTAIKLRWAQHVGFSEFLYSVISLWSRVSANCTTQGSQGRGGTFDADSCGRGATSPQTKVSWILSFEPFARESANMGRRREDQTGEEIRGGCGLHDRTLNESFL